MYTKYPKILDINFNDTDFSTNVESIFSYLISMQINKLELASFIIKHYISRNKFTLTMNN